MYDDTRRARWLTPDEVSVEVQIARDAVRSFIRLTQTNPRACLYIRDRILKPDASIAAIAAYHGVSSPAVIDAISAAAEREPIVALLFGGEDWVKAAARRWRERQK